MITVLSAIGSSAQSYKAVADKIVTTVGDRIILYSDIRNAAEASRLPDGSLPADAICNATERALISKMMLLQAEKDSIRVSDEEVDAELDLRIKYHARALGGISALEQVANKSVFRLKEDMWDAIRENLLVETMQRKIMSSAKITPAEVTIFFNQIPKDSLPFFESELEVGYITIYPKTSRDLEAYVISELNRYRAEIESKAISFEQLAQRFSERSADPEKDKGLQYVLSRNDRSVDPKLMAAVFKMKEGALSAPVKTGDGYFLVQLLGKNGDEAIIRHIFRRVPVAEEEIGYTKARLDSIRSALYAGTIAFNQAAKKFDESAEGRNGEFYYRNSHHSRLLTIDQLDRETVNALTKMSLGDYSAPFVYQDQEGKTAVRMVYLHSRSQPHRMNLKDDYGRIAEAALEHKRAEMMGKWVREKMSSSLIEVDPEMAAVCGNLPAGVREADR
ncbi:peptidylprolyl isomerase [Terrimonas sp. NA20]|uniref:Peptidylprolyl isomerase n=1 Tax=Terrimonas ginsenosidimutans TaxID=2908004 RepID=A0ABS9KUN4_9BACT|nr:peptidylprolyl isomerase [Terrimonas ginsenosidimutans]MCG2616051.1 peptidylprolyl isomerase [Terrimonas ginsenosidimutans]